MLKKSLSKEQQKLLDNFEDELYLYGFSVKEDGILHPDFVKGIGVHFDKESFVKEVLEKEQQEESEDITPTLNRTEQDYILNILNKE